MMKFEIEVPEEELKDAVTRVIADRYYSNFAFDRRHVDRIVAEQVRNVIYKDKERIIDMIVARASRECKSKALKKILEGLTNDELD